LRSCHATGLSTFAASVRAVALTPASDTLCRGFVAGGNAGDMQLPAQGRRQCNLAAEDLGFLRDQFGRIDIVGIKPRDTVAAEIEQPGAIALSGAGEMGNKGAGERSGAWNPGIIGIIARLALSLITRYSLHCWLRHELAFILSRIGYPLVRLFPYSAFIPFFICPYILGL
jgi:hypothetical protein